MAGIQYDPDELVPVDLDKRRHLLYPVAALRLVCKAAGEPDPTKAFAKLLKSDDQLGAIATLIHAGLIHEDRDLTHEQVEWMLTPKRLQAAQEALRKALGLGTKGSDEADPPTASEASA